jgi:AraC-type DNA-binding domain-containing proteins
MESNPPDVKRLVLWIDLRVKHHCPCLSSSLNGGSHVYLVRKIPEIPQAICVLAPQVLCFDYDYPDIGRLQALQRTKAQSPTLPIIMLTERHSEALAIWAFRSRVWDYLIKPLEPFEIQERVDTLFKFIVSGRPESNRKIYQCPAPIPYDFRIYSGDAKVTFSALNYVDRHYHEPIYVRDVATRCGMSESHFCRVFKQEYGVHFTAFLEKYRVEQAIRLLQDPRVSITDVAFSVGFSSPSYFARAFRCYVGVPPSQYRKTEQAIRMPHELP